MLKTLVMKISKKSLLDIPIRFEDGRKIESIHSAKIPAIIGSQEFNIVTDVVDSDILLLLSKWSVKRANMKLNFQDDTIHSMETSLSSQHKLEIMQSQLQKLNNWLTTSIEKLTCPSN